MGSKGKADKKRAGGPPADSQVEKLRGRNTKDGYDAL
jgi:hypothetical protein